LKADALQSRTTDTTIINTDGEWYEVKRVKKCRSVNGQLSYLVSWKDTWVNHQDMSPEALTNFCDPRKRRVRCRRQ